MYNKPLYRKEDRFVCVQVCVDSRLSEVFVLLGDLALQQNYLEMLDHC